MPVCANWPEKLILALILPGTMLLCSCDRPARDFGFEVSGIESAWQNGEVKISLQQSLSLSDEAREALVHGVPLNLQLELVLRNTRGQVRVGSQTRHYEIRYLPLSDHYQLSFSDENIVRTFPRLRHVLADLSNLKMTLETGVLPGGDYEILARCSLQRNKMPPPMRLPMIFSQAWRHDSDWSAWPIEIRPQA